MMICDQCPFNHTCYVGGEHMIIDEEKCPLYKAIGKTWNKYNIEGE